MSTVHQSTSRAQPLPEIEWNRHRPAIERLYRVLELRDVIERMKYDHGFHATDKQYKRQLARWGIRKNVSSKEMMAALSQPGKDTVVRGFRVSRVKVARFERRHCLKKSFSEHDPPLATASLETPEP